MHLGMARSTSALVVSGVALSGLIAVPEAGLSLPVASAQSVASPDQISENGAQLATRDGVAVIASAARFAALAGPQMRP